MIPIIEFFVAACTCLFFLMIVFAAVTVIIFGFEKFGEFCERLNDGLHGIGKTKQKTKGESNEKK